MNAFCLPLEGVPVGGGWIEFNYKLLIVWPTFQSPVFLSSLGGGVTVGDGGGQKSKSHLRRRSED